MGCRRELQSRTNSASAGFIRSCDGSESWTIGASGGLGVRARRPPRRPVDRPLPAAVLGFRSCSLWCDVRHAMVDRTLGFGKSLHVLLIVARQPAERRRTGVMREPSAMSSKELEERSSVDDYAHADGCASGRQERLAISQSRGARVRRRALMAHSATTSQRNSLARCLNVSAPFTYSTRVENAAPGWSQGYPAAFAPQGRRGRWSIVPACLGRGGRRRPS